MPQLWGGLFQGLLFSGSLKTAMKEQRFSHTFLIRRDPRLLGKQGGISLEMSPSKVLSNREAFLSAPPPWNGDFPDGTCVSPVPPHAVGPEECVCSLGAGSRQPAHRCAPSLWAPLCVCTHPVHWPKPVLLIPPQHPNPQCPHCQSCWQPPSPTGPGRASVASQCVHMLCHLEPHQCPLRHQTHLCPGPLSWAVPCWRP